MSTAPEPAPQRSDSPSPGTRRRLPATRSGITHKFSIAGFEGYLTANTYDDGSLGELFINDVGKEGSTLRGALAMFAIATSVALQYGAPPEVLARKLARMNFAPKGPTTNPQMPQAQSLGDYIGRWLASQFCSGDIQAELVASAPPTRPAHPPARSRSSAVPSPPPPATPAPTAAARSSAPAPARPAAAAAFTPAADSTSHEEREHYCSGAKAQGVGHATVLAVFVRGSSQIRGAAGYRSRRGSRRPAFRATRVLAAGCWQTRSRNARVYSSVGGVRHRAPCSRETRYSGLIGHDAGRPTTAPVALLASCECVGDVGSGTCSVACAVLRDGASLRSGGGARATRERRQVTAPRLRRRRVMLAAVFSEEVVQCPRNPSYRLRSTTGQRTR